MNRRRQGGQVSVTGWVSPLGAACLFLCPAYPFELDVDLLWTKRLAGLDVDLHWNRAFG